MLQSRASVGALAFAVLFTGVSRGDDLPAPAGGQLTLKLVARKTLYDWEAGGKTPQEFQADVEEASRFTWSSSKRTPPPPAIDLVLQIVNAGKDHTTIHVGGDSGTHTFDLKGPGVARLRNPVRFSGTLAAKAIELAPGESHDVPVTRLQDGFRG